MAVSVTDDHALRSISYRYAAAVDQRRARDFTALFVPEGRLATCYLPDVEPDRVFQGHAELAQIPAGLGAYDRTFHLVGQGRYAYDPTSRSVARGEVYCVAHHLQRDRHGGVDFVMYIRYQDRYRSDGDEWRIEERILAIDWTEVVPANQAAFRRV